MTFNTKVVVAGVTVIAELITVALIVTVYTAATVGLDQYTLLLLDEYYKNEGEDGD